MTRIDRRCDLNHSFFDESSVSEKITQRIKYLSSC